MHHKKLATVEDPASPEKGIGVYHFCVRSTYLGYIYTFQREYTKALNSIDYKHPSKL